jgi:hypothetical protein
VTILFPQDPLRRGSVDEHFSDEASAANELGLSLALLDDQELRDGQTRAVRGVVADKQVIYRGWMLRSEDYEVLSFALEERGAELRSSPAQYARAHELPGWIEAFADLSAPSLWIRGSELNDFDELLKEFGSGSVILKDYVKSEKHYWREACFIPDVSELKAARKVAQAFLKLRGEDLIGGLVLRRFESYLPGEARTWWVDGEHALTSAHPDQPGESPAKLKSRELEPIQAAVQALDCPFVTVDLARREDGVLRVVEVGDGQVSDRPRTLTAKELLAALFKPAL